MKSVLFIALTYRGKNGWKHGGYLYADGKPIGVLGAGYQDDSMARQRAKELLKKAGYIPPDVRWVWQYFQDRNIAWEDLTIQVAKFADIPTDTRYIPKNSKTGIWLKTFDI